MAQKQYSFDFVLNAVLNGGFSGTFTKAQQEFIRLGTEIKNLQAIQRDVKAYVRVVEEERRRTGKEAGGGEAGGRGRPAGCRGENRDKPVQRRKKGSAKQNLDTRRRHPPCVRVRPVFFPRRTGGSVAPIATPATVRRTRRT